MAASPLWLNDSRDPVSRPVLVYCHAASLGSRLPWIASAKAGVAGAIALLQPFSTRTQVLMKQAQDVAQAVVRTCSSQSPML
ncbi:Sn1-specific diacylglycerol lipase [Salix suchowensis]|nr:Sn1-specific diacylglycerol lipase [Salix suchowensis]